MITQTSAHDPLAQVVDGHEIHKSVEKILHAARTHLRMDVAFISEFRERDRVFRHVDSDADTPILRAGDTMPLEQGYCQRVIDGRLPELIPNTAEVPAASALPETRAVPIGSHLSVPIRLSDGRLYGTFCCFSFVPDSSLNERDLGIMRTLAEVVAYQLDNELEANRKRDEVIRRLEHAIAQGQPSIVYQPIFCLEGHRIAGVECLSRFKTTPFRAPDIWFTEAATVGLGIELELLAIRTALLELGTVPGDFYVGINSSPQTLFSGKLEAALDGMDPRRLMLEITEHDYVDNYETLLAVLAPLRKKGIRVAIDDAGAGYSSMRHILSIRPDMIKLDISLTRNINNDPMRIALASALLEFARHIDSVIVAEGVETEEEINTLYELGVRRVQGFYLGKPMPLAGLRDWLSQPA